MMAHDKNGIKVEAGDWVLYKWYNPQTKKYDELHGTIRRVLSTGDVAVHPAGGASTTEMIEKLPNDKKERNHLLFLRKLES